jgi:hypothetical protein
MAQETDRLELPVIAVPSTISGDEQEDELSHEADLFGHLRVASPCDASWDEMEGDDKVRFCRRCQKHVYNLSWMSRREAAAFVRETEDRLCVRFYRRCDGTLLTDNCPVGWRAVRRGQVKFAGSIAAVAVAFPGVLTPVSEPLVLVGLASYILVGLWGCPAGEEVVLGRQSPVAISPPRAPERLRQTVPSHGTALRPRYRRPWHQRWGRSQWS